MWMALAAICLLIVLSVLGAFFGAAKTKLIFNTLPFGAYWFILLLLLLAGFIWFGRLRRHGALLMIHLGCVLVVAGGVWGSVACHNLCGKLLGVKKIPAGYMVIFEGETEKQVVAEDLASVLGELGFSIRLEDFRLEYYEPDEDSLPWLYIETPHGGPLQLVAEAGGEISLGDVYGKLSVVRTFRNFKISFKDGKKIVSDEAGPAENPAVEVEIEKPDGTKYARYVFGRFEDFHQDKLNSEDLTLRYVPPGPPVVSDYISDLAIIEDGEEKVAKSIEVNQPLRYGGYHFYQHSYDSAEQKYTVLSVASDTGLYSVYAGFWLLCLGVVWWFWLRQIISLPKARNF
jgi:hypothetical protein